MASAQAPGLPPSVCPTKRASSGVPSNSLLGARVSMTKELEHWDRMTWHILARSGPKRHPVAQLLLRSSCVDGAAKLDVANGEILNDT